MNPALICEECEYLQTERAGMAIDSHVPEHEAVAMAMGERCAEHGGGIPEALSQKWTRQARGTPGRNLLSR